MARMAVSAVCDACFKDEARPLDSKFGRESCHRSIPRLRGEQLSSRGSSPRSCMRPCVAKSAMVSGNIQLRLISRGRGLDIPSGVSSRAYRWNRFGQRVMAILKVILKFG